MPTNLPEINELITSWTVLAMENALFVGVLIIVIWVLAAIFYNVKLHLLKKQKKSTELATEKVQEQLMIVEQHFSEAQNKLVENTELLKQEQDNASLLSAKINERHQLVISNIKDIANRFDLSEQLVNTEGDIKPELIWQQQDNIVIQLTERVTSLKKSVCDIEKTHEQELIKLTEKDKAIDDLQVLLASQATQLTKLERVLSAQTLNMEERQLASENVLVDILAKHQYEITQLMTEFHEKSLSADQERLERELFIIDKPLVSNVVVDTDVVITEIEEEVLSVVDDTIELVEEIVTDNEVINEENSKEIPAEVDTTILSSVEISDITVSITTVADESDDLSLKTDNVVDLGQVEQAFSEAPIGRLKGFLKRKKQKIAVVSDIPIPVDESKLKAESIKENKIDINENNEEALSEAPIGRLKGFLKRKKQKIAVVSDIPVPVDESKLKAESIKENKIDINENNEEALYASSGNSLGFSKVKNLFSKGSTGVAVNIEVAGKEKDEILDSDTLPKSNKQFFSVKKIFFKHDKSLDRESSVDTTEDIVIPEIDTKVNLKESSKIKGFFSKKNKRLIVETETMISEEQGLDSVESEEPTEVKYELSKDDYGNANVSAMFKKMLAKAKK